MIHRKSQRKSQFSLEMLETRNLLSSVGLSGYPAQGYVLPNPPIVTAGIQSSGGSPTDGDYAAASH